MTKPKPHITSEIPMLVSPRQYQEWTDKGWIDKNGVFTDLFPLKEFRRSQLPKSGSGGEEQ